MPGEGGALRGAVETLARAVEGMPGQGCPLERRLCRSQHDVLSVRRRVFSVLFDRSNEAISPTVKGLDAALHLPIVAHGPAHGHQTRVQAPIANELIRP